MYQHHNAHTYHQDDTVLGDRPPVIPAFVGKRAGGTKYLDDGDQTKKQENNPDYFVALEQVFYQIH